VPDTGNPNHKETNVMNNLNHCICNVIPPHMLDHAARAAKGKTRTTALNTLEEMHAIENARERALIDIRHGTPQPASTGGRKRNVYDAQHKRTLPGKLVIAEGGGRTGDVEADEAYLGAGIVYEFYRTILGRDSIDGKGMAISSTVHYGVNFDNAMWNGSQMVYGDGDGKLFNRFTSSLDVIGHELTHGVTQFTAGLDYSGQSGALNEHISDAFGIMAKQWSLNLSARESDWLIGASLLAPGVKGKAIRSMKEPGSAYDDPQLGKDPQPGHMRKYVETSEDNGGVHINSGIPNRAFYLAASYIGGYSWTALAPVWFETLKSAVTPHAKFIHFAKDTVAVAGKRFGNNSTVQRSIALAWNDVGLNVKLPPAHSTSILFPLTSNSTGASAPVDVPAN
jgi:Zn-dependent metalloprotease